MVEFNLWFESFIFAVVFAVIIIIPCVLVAVIGKKAIDEMGQCPSKTPLIQMRILWKLISIEVFAFLSLIIFYRFFEK